MHTEESLQQSLENYSRTAQAMQPITDAKGRWKERAAFASAAGAAMAASSAAEAAIIYSDPPDVVAQIFGNGDDTEFAPIVSPSVGIELNVHRHIFTTSSSSTFVAQFGRMLGQGGVTLIHDNVGAPFLEKFAANAPIAGPNVATVAVATASDGNFANHVTGFAGFIVGGNKPGWMRVRWDDTAGGDGVIDKMTIFDWAYNDTPGGTILAGQMPVPEPNALALAAMGAVGVLALRRKRQRPAA